MCDTAAKTFYFKKQPKTYSCIAKTCKKKRILDKKKFFQHCTKKCHNSIKIELVHKLYHNLNWGSRKRLVVLIGSLLSQVFRYRGHCQRTFLLNSYSRFSLFWLDCIVNLKTNKELWIKNFQLSFSIIFLNFKI